MRIFGEKFKIMSTKSEELLQKPHPYTEEPSLNKRTVPDEKKLKLPIEKTFSM